MAWHAGRGGRNGGVDFDRSRAFATMEEAGVYALDHLGAGTPARQLYVAEGENSGGTTWRFSNIHTVTRIRDHIFYSEAGWP